MVVFLNGTAGGHQSCTCQPRKEPKMKSMCGVLLLVWMPVAAAKSEKAYPKAKVAEFVVQKLDATSLPLAIRPKRGKGKKTFADYGYLTQTLDDKEALVEAPQGGSQITISVLEENRSGIYVCFNGEAQKQGSSQIQRVFLLTVKTGDGLLKGRESWKEFESCPVIGGADSDGVTDAYGGG